VPGRVDWAEDALHFRGDLVCDHDGSAVDLIADVGFDVGGLGIGRQPLRFVRLWGLGLEGLTW
jgi:hypothetical protein